MACFLAPAAEAVVVSVVRHNYKKKEELCFAQHEALQTDSPEIPHISLSQKLGWLTNLLWGGSFLLFIEHIWHGEIVPWFPFLTAMYNPSDIRPMLMEILTTGISMAFFVTAIWGIMVLLTSFFEKKSFVHSLAQRKAGI